MGADLCAGRWHRISAEEQDKIFSRFYRTDKARSRELGGSGLGLGIVQWIAQAHDGKITVESKVQAEVRLRFGCPGWRKMVKVRCSDSDIPRDLDTDTDEH